MQAGFLSVKLKHLDRMNQHRNKLANLYHTHLSSSFILPVDEKDNYNVYHIFNIRHERRDRLREFLLKNDIKTEIHYPIAPNKQPAMRGILDKELTPIAEEIHRTTLSLPISSFHTSSDIEKVIDVMNSF